METDAKVRGLGNFKAEEFEATEYGFHNLPSQKTRATNTDLRYVIHDSVVPVVLPDVATGRMYQIRITREAFREDNWKFFRMLKEYLIN